MTTDRPLEEIGKAAQCVWNHRPGHHQPATNVAAGLLRQRDAIRSVLGQHLFEAVVLVVGRIGFDYLSLLCALRATGARPHPSLVLLAYAATTVLALLPLTPGGLGIVEGSLSGLLVLAGVGASNAVVATLAYPSVPTGFRRLPGSSPIYCSGIDSAHWTWVYTGRRHTANGADGRSGAEER